MCQLELLVFSVAPAGEEPGEFHMACHYLILEITLISSAHFIGWSLSTKRALGYAVFHVPGIKGTRYGYGETEAQRG